MNRKVFTRLLSIALALLLPAAAMAQGTATDVLQQAYNDGQEIVTTITFEPGAALASDTAVADLSKVAALRFTGLKGGYGALSISLSDKDVVSALFKVTQSGLFAQSEVLGTQPAFMAWDDVQTYMDSMMQNSEVPQASAAQFSQGFAAGIQQWIAEVTADEPAPAADPVTEADFRQAMLDAMHGDDGLIKWMDAIDAKKVVTKGEFAVEGADKADTKTEVTVTGEDMAALYDIPYMQEQILQQIKMTDPSLTDEQAVAKQQDMLNAIKEELIQAGATMPIVVYTQGEGEGARLVAFEMTLTGAFTSEQVTTATDDAATADAITPAKRLNVEITARYTAATTADGEAHTFKMKAAQEGTTFFSANATFDAKAANGALTVVDFAQDKQQLAMAFTADYADPDHIVAELAITVPGNGSQASTVLLSLNKTDGEAAKDVTLSLASGASVNAIKADLPASLIGTLHIHIAAQADSGLFASLKEASVIGSRQVLKMTEAELNSYMLEIQGNAQKLMLVVMSNLPTSVITQIFNTPSGT